MPFLGAKPGPSGPDPDFLFSWGQKYDRHKEKTVTIFDEVDVKVTYFLTVLIAYDTYHFRANVFSSEAG